MGSPGGLVGCFSGSVRTDPPTTSSWPRAPWPSREAGEGRRAPVLSDLASGSRGQGA